MAARSSWKGYLKLSLVSVPVKAYTTSSGGGNRIQLNQLHDKCHSRIRYKKTCPIHGEVPNDEIVSGYQFAKDQYVEIDPDELKTLRAESDRSIEIDTFIQPDQLDAMYHTEKSYYLVPDGAIGQKPYNLIRQALEEEQLHAVAQIILSNREQLVLIRPVDKLLTMTVLQYAADVKSPQAFDDEVQVAETSSQELRLTKQLIESLVRDDWDLQHYTDRYYERLSQLVQSKIEGEELVTPPHVEEPQVINLMDALKASLQQIPVPQKKTAAAPAAEKPRRKAAASTKAPSKRGAKRKSG